MAEWGWRIPFWIAGPIGVVGLYLRLKLEDSPAFRKKLDEHGHELQQRESQGGLKEIKQIFVRHWRAMLICGGLVLLYNVTNYMMTGFMPTFLKSAQGTPALLADLAVLGSMLVVVAVIVFLGALSDRIGRKPVFVVGAVAQIVLAIPMFLLITRGGTVGIVIGCLVLGLCLACFAAPTAAALPALFPTAVRYGALSIAFNVAVSAFGGTTPLANEALISAVGTPMVPAYFLVVSGAVGLLALLAYRETATQPLEGSPPQVSDGLQADQLSADTHQLATVLTEDAAGDSDNAR